MYLCVCMYVYLYICIYVRMHVCLHIRVCTIVHEHWAWAYLQVALIIFDLHQDLLTCSTSRAKCLSITVFFMNTIAFRRYYTGDLYNGSVSRLLNCAIKAIIRQTSA